MSTASRDRLSALARTAPEEAFAHTLLIDEPWFACQAMASVLRYGPASMVAKVNAELSRRADECHDDYQRGAVRACQLRALLERSLAAEALEVLECATGFASRAEPLASRAEALFLLFQAAHPLPAGNLVPLVEGLADVWKAAPWQWRCSRALVCALAMLSALAPAESERILRAVGDERIRRRVERATSLGLTSPRLFFW